MDRLPAKTALKGTGFGINQRELIIVGSAVLLMLIVFATPFTGLLPRIVLGFGLVTGATLYALWRVKGYWTIERWLIRQIRYQSGKRRYLKGQAVASVLSEPLFAQESPSQAQQQGKPSSVVADAEAPLFRLPSWLSPESNSELMGYVTAIFSIVALLAWIGTSGVREITLQMQAVFDSLRSMR